MTSRILQCPLLEPVSELAHLLTDAGIFTMFLTLAESCFLQLLLVLPASRLVLMLGVCCLLCPSEQLLMQIGIFSCQAGHLLLSSGHLQCQAYRCSGEMFFISFS